MTQEKPNFKKGSWVVIKAGFMDEGKVARVLGQAVYEQQWWVPVKFNHEEDPTFFKAAGLEALK